MDRGVSLDVLRKKIPASAGNETPIVQLVVVLLHQLSRLILIFFR